MSTPKTRKEKGKLLENYIADQIIEKGLDSRAKRDGPSGAGNREKADVSTSMMILGRNAGIEAKNWKIPHIKDWWKQTQKLEKLNREPVLVYKLGGESLGEAKAVIYLDTLLELIKHQKPQEEINEIRSEESYDKRQALWEADKIKTSINKLLKYLKK